MIRREELTVTTDSLGAGTVVSTSPISGLVYYVRNNGATFGSTADFTLTRLASDGGGTILNVADAVGPWEYSPRYAEHSIGGGSVGADAFIPVDGHVRLIVAQGGSVSTGVVHVFYLT